jgi:hypothetical protein
MDRRWPSPSFDQLWSYKHEARPRRFFDSWRAPLKRQRRKRYEKFADIVESRWDPIAAYCKGENKVSRGVVEASITKSASSDGRGCGLRDEDYLRLKTLTCMLPTL